VGYAFSMGQGPIRRQVGREGILSELGRFTYI
jgi:hypothetical protein